LALAAAGALILAACGDDDDTTSDTDASAATDAPAETDAPAATDAPETTEATETTAAETEETDAPAAETWTVNTDDCVDPDAANAPIEGTIKVGSVMPLSGGPAASAFAPVAAGFQAYVDYANENKLLGDVAIELSIADDQYSPTLTPGAVEGLLDAGVQMFTGIIGTPNNLAVRDVLNEECVPQILNLTGAPQWGEIEDYPWTTGALVPYDDEVQGYLKQLSGDFPDGGTIALFTVNTDFGQVYVDSFNEYGPDAGWELVDEQTIEATETAPPTAQVNSIATKAPDVILAAPSGAQCATFLAEIANAKAANPGWAPRVYMTSTCASPLILAVSGAAADGMFTAASGGIADTGNPEVIAGNPDIQAYADYMIAAGKADIVTTASAGWTIGEVMVAILMQAAESPDGLTQASIINAARNLDYEPSLVRDGIVYKTSGEEDPYTVEAVQVVQFDATNKIFNDIGDLVLDFESS